MRRYSVLFVVLISLFGTITYGQYWFQTGAKSNIGSSQNYGASVYIQTEEPLNTTLGSFGFWIGEDLQNGAFLQVGYEIPNSSGFYPTYCDPSGCDGNSFLKAGYATWFWEYFPSGYTGSNFYGGIGQNDSAGPNGTINRYWFESNGDVWNIYFNNKMVGSVNLGTQTSGSGYPNAYAELAGTDTNEIQLTPVIFKNMSIYKNGQFVLVPSGYSYIGYGVNSAMTLKNPYGVKEVSDLADYFEVGSGIPYIPNGTVLWTNIYYLGVVSQYGNATGSGYYSTFSRANFTVQKYIYITPYEREAFTGWVGTGFGSYTGTSNFAQAMINTNETETATWQTQYYVNVNQQYGNATGSGWYLANTTATISIPSNMVNTSNGTREVFRGWSNGEEPKSFQIRVTSQINVSAAWQKQYYVGLSTPYGIANGSGWYNSGSEANISLSEQYINATNNSRIAFYSWSNVYNKTNVTLTVNSPLHLSAVYIKQYRISLAALDAYSRPINTTYFDLGSNKMNTSQFFFSGIPYTVAYVYYKNTFIPLNYTFKINSNSTVEIRLPVDDVEISTQSIFKKPVNATLYLTFKNGSTITEYSNGNASLYDVPYGFVSGYGRYLGITESINANGGSNVSLVFFTLPAVLMLVAVIIVMFLFVLLEKYVSAKRYKGRKR